MVYPVARSSAGAAAPVCSWQVQGNMLSPPYRVPSAPQGLSDTLHRCQPHSALCHGQASIYRVKILQEEKYIC